MSTRELLIEQVEKRCALDFYNRLKQRALQNPWTKSAFEQTAREIATDYDLPVGEFDFIEFTEVSPNTHIMDLVEWQDAIDTGAIISDDGDGYWMKHGMVSDVDCFNTKPAWATHVAWYNK